ncbi:MAG: Rho termination factor N-terminal domain-containing protein, partial [Bacteroidota bacterium]
MYDILELSKKLLPELKDIAKELKIKKAESLKKQDLIYKILDQQAIEATEIKPTFKIEKEDIRSSSEVNNQESDSSMRRGKRPRTLKTVVKRSIESVMSVSPGDLKRPEIKPAERQEQVKRPERIDEKPDLFKNAELVPQERKAPKWRTDQRPDERSDKKE